MEIRTSIPRVKDVFPVTNGLFSSISYELPMDAGQLDLLFFTDFGLKTVAPLVSAVLNEDTTLSQEKLTLLGTMLLNKYKNKWDRYKAISRAEYDPLHNYLDEYSESGSISRDETDTRTRNLTTVESLSETISNTRTDNLSESRTTSEDSTTTENGADNRYGLNSSTATGVTTDSQSTVVDDDSTSTRTNTGTQSNSGTNTSTRNLTDGGTDTKVFDEDSTRSKEGYHRGNIGNISTQKLVNEEIELWKWNFANEILQDARDFLTLPIYIGVTI